MATYGTAERLIRRVPGAGNATNWSTFTSRTSAVRIIQKEGPIDVSDAMRFLLVLRGVLGKRLTYRRLAAIGDSGFMGIK